MRHVGGYTASEVDEIIARLQAAASASDIDREEVQRQLLDLLVAVGCVAETDYDDEFNRQLQHSAFRIAVGRPAADQRELDESRHLSLPSKVSAKKAELYRRIGQADDSSLAQAIVEALKHDRTIATEMRAQLGAGRLTSVPVLSEVTELCDLAGIGLSPDPEQLRAVASRLEASHAAKVSAGQPRKLAQLTLLMRLADIFLHFTRSDGDRADLPHAERSHFITFAHLALHPFFPRSEVTPAALSSAWKRAKQHDQSGKPD